MNYALLGRRKTAWAVGIATAAVLLASAVKHVVALREARKKASLHELEGCLFTLHAMLDSTALATLVDTSEREFFTVDRQELVLSAVSGIAVFIRERSA